ncbi:nucleoid DNA-binding protein [Rhodopseudomonas julia]|uniref:Nucleoid DNA-binding protein n=1 Tax=Rhodopseudomonas julia TaxID=200617 RepID=A0ABU0C2N6_9BRAD|nr:nucleoid DNA-binding protein [Rhodopseudomonas julia]
MNKQDLVAEVAQRTGLSMVAAGKVVDAVFREMRERLAAGEKVDLFGFGSLTVVARAARMGRNPRTGARLDIPATNSVRFSAAKSVKEALGGTRKSALAGDPVNRAPGLSGKPVTPAPGLPGDPITSAPGTGGGRTGGTRRRER